MPVPHRELPTRLRVELLEARLTPAAYDLSRVLVTTAGPSQDDQCVAVLRQSPVVADVVKLGDRLFQADLTNATTVENALADLSSRDGVASAQPDYKLTLSSTVVPNDPGYNGAWQYTATAATTAWGVTTGTGATIVAVIDTGVDVTHPDLAANIWRNPREIAGNGRDDDGNGYVDDVTGWNFAENNPNVADSSGHGTHAAGIIGAVGNNGQGVVGVDWRTRIMPLRFMSGSSGGFTSDAVRAIDYAVANGARVINQSWGGGPYDAALAAATQRAQAAGVVIVSAAGNYATNTDTSPFYPAAYTVQYDNVVSVAASTPTDQLAAFSNFGRTSVTLAAPGQWITSTAPGGGYVERSGTSMAAPFVAGAVSLLWDAHPDWSYRQVLDKVKTSVDVLPGFAGKVATGGRINLSKLLASPPVSTPTPTVPPSSPTAPSGVRAVEAVIGGPRTGTIDRAWVRFTAAVDPVMLTASVTLTTPLGTFSPSAVRPVTGTGNTQFTLVFPRSFTTSGNYNLIVGSPAVAVRFTQAMTLGSTPSVPPVSPPPVTVPPPPASPPNPPAPTGDRQNVAAAGLPRAVPAGRTTRIELYVPMDVTIRDAAVQLSVQHARVSDLSIRLTAPDGRRFTLFNRRGGAGEDLANTLFTDAAVQSLAAVAAPFDGAVKPEQSLSALNGSNGRGLWVIELFNLNTTTGGTLTGVTLSFAVSATQSIAWVTAPTSTVVTQPEIDHTKPTSTVKTEDTTARPDTVVFPPSHRLTVPRPADLTSWLVGRLRTRL